MYPVIERYALSTDSDWSALAIPDPQQAGRMPEMLKAIGILRREVGDEVLVVGCALGPFTLTSQLLGLETTLYLAVDDPERSGAVNGLCDRSHYPIWPGSDSRRERIYR